MPGGEPWDGGMVRQAVDGDGNCFIPTALRCSDYDPAMPEAGPEYETKVSKLRAEIVDYLVEHADSVFWTNTCEMVVQRSKRSKTFHSSGDYCAQIVKDGTYMGDLKIQAFCNLRNVTVQVATDAILHDDNPRVALSTGFSPYHILDEQIVEATSVATYHVVHRGVGHFEPCMHYEQVSGKISPVEPSVYAQSSEINERIDDPAEDDDGSSEDVQPGGGAEDDRLASACHVQIDLCHGQ